MKILLAKLTICSFPLFLKFIHHKCGKNSLYDFIM